MAPESEADTEGMGCATLSECEDLMRHVEHLIGVAETAEAGPGSEKTKQIVRQADFVPQIGGRFAEAHARATFIHYGSPFELRLLLECLTIPGLVALFYGAKRIFGVDFEFKAYREKRRAEFLEARAIAEELQVEREVQEQKMSGSPLSPATATAWKAERAAMRDGP